MTPKTAKFQAFSSSLKKPGNPSALNQENTILPSPTPKQHTSWISIPKNQTVAETEETTKELKRIHSLTKVASLDISDIERIDAVDNQKLTTKKPIESESNWKSENSYTSSELEDNVVRIHRNLEWQKRKSRLSSELMTKSSKTWRINSKKNKTSL